MTKMHRWRIVLIIVSLTASSIVAVALTRKVEIGDVFPSQGTFEVSVRDNDPSQGEGYLNENLTITYSVFGQYLRNVGDPDLGLTVSVTDLTRSWGPFIADVKGQTDYTRGYIEENGDWTVSAVENTYIRWRLVVPVQSHGEFLAGIDMYLYLWADTDNNEANGYGTAHKPATTLWNTGDSMKVTVTSYGEQVPTTPEEDIIQGTNLIR